MTDEDKNLLDHDYDGIRELDNPLPDWWLITFLATIMFAFFYFIHYEFSGGQTIAQELSEDIAYIDTLRATDPGPKDSEEELAKLLGVATVMEEGKTVFATKCSACHGLLLQGLIGPNLTDDFWIHGDKLVDISATIRKGILDKGMPKWEDQLKDDEIKAVTVYIASQRGTKPPNPKPPQGEKCDRH